MLSHSRNITREMIMSTQLDQPSADTTSRLAALGAVIETSGGNCPVQIEGQVNGEPFYFRARGERWQVWAGPGADTVEDASLFETHSYLPDGMSEEEAKYAAGWMDEAEALELLASSLERRAASIKGGIA